MSARTGPPEDDAARTVSPKRPGPCVKGLAKTHQRLQATTASRHIGRYTAGWRDGFTAGAADALRVAARHLPVETWHIIESLANQYELVGSDE
jgi:hypothetical protein